MQALSHRAGFMWASSLPGIKSDAWRAVMWVLIAAFSVGGFWVGFSLMDRDFPSANVHSSIIPTGVIIYPGDVLQVQVAIDYVRSGCSATMDREFVDADGQIFPLPGFQQGSQLAGHRSSITLTKMSNHIAPGFAVYTSRVKYWCNDWQKLLWPMTAP